MKVLDVLLGYTMPIETSEEVAELVLTTALPEDQLVRYDFGNDVSSVMPCGVDSFIAYKSFYDAIMELSEKNQLELFHAIFLFALYGIEPKLTGVSRALWFTIRPQLLANLKRRIKGYSGGNPNFKEGKPNPYYPKDNHTDNHADNHADNHDITMTLPNVNVNGNVNVNDNVNVNGNGNGNGNIAKETNKKSEDFSSLNFFEEPLTFDKDYLDRCVFDKHPKTYSFLADLPCPPKEWHTPSEWDALRETYFNWVCHLQSNSICYSDAQVMEDCYRMVTCITADVDETKRVINYLITEKKLEIPIERDSIPKDCIRKTLERYQSLVDSLKVEEGKKKKTSSIDYTNPANLPDFVSDDLRDVFLQWLTYKKNEHNDAYKTEQSLRVCYNQLVSISGGVPMYAQMAIDNAIASRWKGFAFPSNKPQVPKEQKGSAQSKSFLPNNVDYNDTDLWKK